ncbi:hypothetical protein ABZ568_00585 [Streptomyces olindensis]|uniref:Uncharacterized protein n=1 Tax=Streptomyces olindensis TaxID=358823 RepID=A0ABV2XLT7_9ACTN
MATPTLDHDERIKSGVRRGKKRLGEGQLHVRQPLVNRVRVLVSGYIDKSGEEYTPWFWEFAAEALTIAIGARIANREPKLQDQELYEYIDMLAKLANSWRHSL